MDVNPELEKLRDDVLRKIGRNVILFQELERILKFLVCVQRISAPMSKFQQHHDQRQSEVSKQTLGQITRKLQDNFNIDPNEPPDFPSQIDEPWFSYSFGIEADQEFFATGAKSLDALVEERNNLIHHLLPRWDLHSTDSCNAIALYLDEQRGRAKFEIDKYMAFVNGFREMGKAFQAFTASDEGAKLFNLIGLQQTRVVSMLQEIALTSAREDGWTLLSTAGAHLTLRIANDFQSLKTRYGSLQRLIAATELFDIKTEETSGGIRYIYRPLQLTA